MYRSILAVACAVLAVSCVKNPGSETPDPGTDTPDVSHFQTAEQYTVPTKAGQITTVKMNGVTLAEASSPMKIWIPRYARTKAAAAPEVIYTPADEYPNGFAGNKAQLFQVVCFEDSRSGDYDYYISEPVRDNDPKAVGPFINLCLERERLQADGGR